MDATGLLEDLDDLQRRAVSTPANPLRILAGAGSGKTRVLTRRIAHRVATGSADPRRVLTLTFTRKAAGELRRRLRQLGLRDEIAAGTFHGVAYAQIRARWADRGVEPWTLVDRKVPLVVPLLPASQRGGTSALDIVTEIEWAKARRITPSRYKAAATRARRRPAVDPAVIAEVFDAYESTKRKKHLLDFDDLLRGWHKALTEDESFAAAQRWRYRHVFVDEFQDVNPLQHAVLEALLVDNTDLCVVGDPNQAIYAWNGADAEYLVDFEGHWPGAASVELIDNYRSSPEILDAAAAVLAGARHQVGPSRLRPHRAPGAPPTIRSLPDDTTEATAVARAVRSRHLPGRSWGRQAVLVRTNAQTALLEQALRRSGVPCRVRGGSGLLDQPEIRQTVRELRRATPQLATVIADLEVQVRSARAAKDPDDPTSQPDLTQPDETAPEGDDDRAANLEALLRLARDFAALAPDADASGFVSWLSSTARSDGLDAGADAVDIATFHAAKGLEWPVVHLAGLEDGLVPIGHARTPDEQDEERRLFYVAVTRAEEELHCTWAQERTFGSRAVGRRRSPFLDEIDAAFSGEEPAKPAARSTKTSRAPRRTVAESDPVRTAIRAWRSDRARAARTPAYTVFNDETLDELAARRPHTLDDLLRVRGIGPVKASRFGEELLTLIAEHDA